ncbi:hypothetical protein IC229_05890 [Spirosoma sp. BT702]|uniref:Phage virion morphogenesis protein n=1 Tax=Spirosoma profusum TaxID=2771354 RepID=A0A926XY30_9BACT|nr:hypothetical protein [Spirosoma profusum]MBD2700157.1 hypothetical protein [Spirosoma profusum]
MTNYSQLDINQRINLKGLVEAWSSITIERMQKQIDQKVYGRRRPRSRKRSLVRTGKLRSDWRKRLYVDRANGGIKGMQLSFMLYGRFDDMGVGKGTTYALSKYQRVRKNGETMTRKPSRWYSKEKAHQVHRLRELMARYYVNITLAALENYLTDAVTVHV